MRKFFSFRPLESTSANVNYLHPAPSSSGDLICCETLGDNHTNFRACEKVQDHSQTVKDTTVKALDQYPKNEDSSPLLRRSHSLTSCALNSGLREGNFISLSDVRRPVSSCGNSPLHAASCPTNCHLLTPDRYTRPKSSGQSPSQHSHSVQKYGSPSSLRDCEISSGNSTYSSPIRLRCNEAQLSQFPKGNKFLDHQIDGGHQEVKPKTHPKNCLSESGIDFCLADNGAYPSVGRPQQVQSAELFSPMHGERKNKTYSFREDKDSFHDLPAQNWARDDYRTVSLWRHIKMSKEPPHTFHGKLTMNSQDYDSESTTTFEDIYTDSFEMQPIWHSDDIVQDYSTDDKPSYKKPSGHFAQDSLRLEKYDCFLQNGTISTKNGKIASSELQDTDEELLQKLKEVEKMIEALPEEDFDVEELQSSDLDVPSLFQTITKIKEDRKYLVLEVSAQIKCRLAERYAAKGNLRQARKELKTQTRRLEMEKNEFQFSLEKELDRRSKYWSVKLEMMQLEEQRLREQLRELAEQNVSFQREISSVKFIEGDNQLTNLTASLEQLRTENFNLQKTLSELQDHFNATEQDRVCIRRCFREKEKENKELQKLVVCLHRTCNEQEKTINGLRQRYSDEIENKAPDRSNQLSRLQMEQLRLTGIEQNLRKELRTCKFELETLRQENIKLLTRLQAASNGCLFSSIKLDQELLARVDCLQTEGLSLLNDISHFSGDLLAFLRRKQFENGHEAASDTNGYTLFDYTIKSQSLSRRYENFRRSLQTIATILDEKSVPQATEYQSLPAEGSISKQSENELEIKLNEEIILTKLLREKLHSNELEIERLQADLASSIWVHDVLKTEIQRMQDEVSYLTHKTTDMQLKMLQKDETIKQLENDYQECTKELTAARNMSQKVNEERNHMWEDVKSSREKIMLLNYEVLSLKRNIDELEEEVLTKDGHIAILRDSLEKPFGTICSPRSLKEFSLE